MPPFWKKRSNPPPTDLAGGPYHTIPDNKSIRYMVLEAGKDDEPLVCSLHVSRLRKMPYFEAISYVWGSDDQNHDILCDGKIVKITTNLQQVLRRVRLATASRTLWADSICINQDDGVEKGEQVRLMGAIFSKADRVLVCFGENEDGPAERVASLISELNDMILEEFTFVGEAWNAFPWLDLPAKERLLLDERWKSFEALLQNPWFSRGWVVQEAGLSNNAVIFWGKVEIKWICFIRTLTWMLRRLPELTLNLPRRIRLYAQLYKDRTPRESITLYEQGRPKFEILQVLDHARGLQLKLDSDRVYGFLAFAEDAKLFHDIRPNYSLPALAVYADFARRYLRKTLDLSILHFVQHTNVTIAETNVPSWIPRWNIYHFITIPGEFSRNKITSSSWNSWQKFSLLTENGDTLNVRGIVFDYVHFTFGVFSYEASMDEIGRLWRTISRSKAVTVYPQRYRETIFLQTLGLDLVAGDHSRWKQGLLAYIRFLKLGATLSEQEKQNASFNHHWIMLDAANRRFIVTNRGYYGLAPLATQDDDVCCIIIGAKSPFILRRTGKERYYRVVGDVYMPGKELGYNSFSATQEEDDVCAYELGEDSKDWVEYGLKEQDIHLC
ncbi:HET-domain-containing protein [Hyaloscypha hepaticicola]|uniref:HET-domain-containing protein n=1 Tax=Hyaloscypha hepaticicola TaxID=2082293 RepID=A0A2J6PK40_9HELO|nr:HET-domain-containing protein [Hyaloscypha hepaticicola]